MSANGSAGAANSVSIPKVAISVSVCLGINWMVTSIPVVLQVKGDIFCSQLSTVFASFHSTHTDMAILLGIVEVLLDLTLIELQAMCTFLVFAAKKLNVFPLITQQGPLLKILSWRPSTRQMVAIDWVARKLYWTDREHDKIEVSDLNGNNRLTLYDQGLDRPRAIVLDPANGYLYWSDWGRSSKIERAGMDGQSSSRQAIVTSGLVWPNALTIDYTIQKIFWGDAKLKKIEYSNYDGSNRQTLVNLEPKHHPFAMTVFENHLYFTDWSRRSRGIWMINKFNGRNKRLIKRGIFAQMDVHFYHPLRQPNVTNPCATNNGGCSHLCLLSTKRQKYSCKCPKGFRAITSDERTCEAIPTTATSTTIKPTTASTTTKAPTTTTTPTITTTPTQRKPASTSTVRQPKSTTKDKRTKSNASVDKSTTSTTPHITSPTTQSNTGRNETVAAKKGGGAPSSGIKPGIIVVIVIVILLVIVALVMGVWYWRMRSRYSKASISYFKDVTTKPLQEDFEDDEGEPLKVYSDDDISRCKVDFA